MLHSPTLLAALLIPAADPEPAVAADLVLVGGKVWTEDLGRRRPRPSPSGTNASSRSGPMPR
jgi:hypothetical protein